MAIHHWPQQLRPRERLMQLGPHALSDAELLAIFLRVGTRGKSAVQMGHDMLTHFGSLGALFKADLAQWSEIKGLGPASFVQFAACMELAKRSTREATKSGDMVSEPESAKYLAQLHLRHSTIERFLVLFLNNRNELIDSSILFEGTLTETAVYPRELARRALSCGANKLIVAHNHPSGQAQASDADIRLTRRLESALATLDIQLLDHIIIAGHQSISLRQNGGWGT